MLVQQYAVHSLPILPSTSSRLPSYSAGKAWDRNRCKLRQACQPGRHSQHSVCTLRDCCGRSRKLLLMKGGKGLGGSPLESSNIAADTADTWTD